MLGANASHCDKLISLVSFFGKHFVEKYFYLRWISKNSKRKRLIQVHLSHKLACLLCFELII